MKFAFSTLGCPSWDYQDIVSTAKDLGYDGIEIRGISDVMYAPKIKAFQPENLCKSLERLAPLEIPMLTSNCCIAIEGEKEQCFKEAVEYITLANKIGAKFIRVLCTNCPGLDGGDYNLALKAYKNLCVYAEDYNVTPLIETNGMFCNSELLAKFINSVNIQNSGVLWDIHHPFRFNGESIDTTLKNIGKFIKYTHIKDSIVENGRTVYKMLGKGDIPIKAAIDGLQNIDYKGYVSLEWVKRWNPDLEEPGIVFAHYINKIKEFC